MHNNELSTKQIQIIEFIKKELSKKGYPPSVREICDAVDLKSTSTVHGHLERLEKKGYIRRDPTKPRAIEVLDNDIKLYKKETIDLPIVGRVTAGEPILAQQNIEDIFPVPIEFVGKGNSSFVLMVKGDSMINAGILDGDYVIVRQQSTAMNGDIVVALLNGEESTIKTFYKEKGYYRLQPENPYLSPIIVTELEILGIVTGVFRKLR